MSTINTKAATGVSTDDPVDSVREYPGITGPRRVGMPEETCDDVAEEREDRGDVEEL